MHEWFCTDTNTIFLPRLTNDEDVVSAEGSVVKRGGDIPQLIEKSLCRTRRRCPASNESSTIGGHGPCREYVDRGSNHVRARETNHYSVIDSVDGSLVNNDILKDEKGSHQ